MTGYQEILTDPSYCQQIVTMTVPHIGNYGVNPDDYESDRIQVAGFVVIQHTRPIGTCDLLEYFKAQNVVAISDVDTRALVSYIRDNGAMNAVVTTEVDRIEELKIQLAEQPSMVGLELASKVSTKEPYFYGNPEAKYKVAAVDLGIKKILQLLESHGCNVTVFPAHVTSKEILDFNPDGVFLSNGPGDPEAVTYGIETVKKLLGEKPIFGICLGHQSIGAAFGGNIIKAKKIMHRGANQPVVDLVTGSVAITSQNHGFAVADPDAGMLAAHPSGASSPVAGIALKNKPVFSVQYHPEASAGPHDSRYLFDTFIENMKTFKALVTKVYYKHFHIFITWW